MASWRDRLAGLARPRRTEPLPVRLDRRRIYVLPTRFGLFFGALLAAMILGALNYNNNPALLLALLLAAAALASLIAAHLQLSGLRLVALSADPVAAGHPLPLALLLHGAGARTRRGLRLQCRDATAWIGHLPPEASVEAVLYLSTERRGWLEPGRIRIETTQPLGLARAWAWFRPETDLLVYPRPEPQGPPAPSATDGAGPPRRDATGEDLHHLRPYRAGDTRGAIAWKPSARQAHLMVREYERPAAAELLLDWRSLAPLPTESRIARLARWVDEAEREGRRYRLQLPGQPVLGPAQGPAHHHACLRALALLPHD